MDRLPSGTALDGVLARMPPDINVPAKRHARGQLLIAARATVEMHMAQAEERLGRLIALEERLVQMERAQAAVPPAQRVEAEYEALASTRGHITRARAALAVIAERRRRQTANDQGAGS